MKKILVLTAVALAGVWYLSHTESYITLTVLAAVCPTIYFYGSRIKKFFEKKWKKFLNPKEISQGRRYSGF